MDPRPTAPTEELEEQSPQEKLESEQHAEHDDPDQRATRDLLQALHEPGALRADELVAKLDSSRNRDEWKRRLWRLHNEGYLKVRWVGLVDPDPVEVRLTERGRDWLAESFSASRSRSAGAAQEGKAQEAIGGGGAPPPR